MRRHVALAVLIVALAAAAAWLVARIVPGAPPPRSAVAIVEPPPRPPAGAEALAAQALDPAEQDRLATRAEARERYAALRDAFAAGRPSATARSRLDPAVAALWPAPGHAEIACRGLICRVLPSPAPGGWQAALAAHDGIRALAERVAVDPDASTTPAYLQLLPLLPRAADPLPPPRGDEFLRTIESRVRASSEVAACLAGAEPGQDLELHLTLDGTGLGYRMGAGLGPQPSLCATAALAPIMATPAPPGVVSGERSVKVERPARPVEAPQDARSAEAPHDAPAPGEPPPSSPQPE